MAEEDNVHLALFNDINPATDAMDKLRELGIPDEGLTIISGVPFTEKMLGRPTTPSHIPKFAMAGFLGGFLFSLLLNWGAVKQYPVSVGGMPDFAIPPFIVLMFEISMLGLMTCTFLGVIWECEFPSFGQKMYRPEISDGRVAVVFNCPPEIHTQIHEALAALGAEWVHRTEAVKL